MSKKNKNKVKKVSPRKEKYKKFHKEKSASLDISMPDLDDVQVVEKREDEVRIDKFLKFRQRNEPPKEVRERKALSKR